jgi:hypothetical protein
MIRSNIRVKLTGKTVQAIVARRIGSYTQLIAPVGARSLPLIR